MKDIGNEKNNRNRSFVIITVHYIVAAILGYATWAFAQSQWPPYWAIFAADVVATIYIWILGLVYKNVSFYDPYWSVAPPIFLTAWAVKMSAFTLPTILVLLAVWIWAIRLTYNWIYTFHGLAYEDWRYTKFRVECSPFVFQLINFFGLNMVPTLVVFMAMLPAVDMMGVAGNGGVLVWIGFAVSVGAVCLQLISDRQAHAFRAEHPGKVCNVGLWRRGRHPNYLGEILMWWGVWLMYVSVCGIEHYWWMVAGPISVTLLFRFISVPLMENRQLLRKPDYAEYKRNTRMFI